MIKIFLTFNFFVCYISFKSIGIKVKNDITEILMKVALNTMNQTEPNL